MMRDSLPLDGIRFGNADVEPPVEIPRVGIHDFSGILTRQCDAETGLAYGRWTGDDDDARARSRALLGVRCGSRLVVARVHGTYYDDIESVAIGLTGRCKVIAGGSR